MENTFKGIDLGMNAAILHMASRLFPCGFDVVPDSEAPNTLERVQADILQGRLRVSGDHCEGTAYGDPEVNIAFRAWHDWTHWRHSTPFTLEGEIATAWLQVGHLRTVGLWSPFREAFLLSEVEDQARYYAKTGAFPVDQMGVTLVGIRKRIGYRDACFAGSHYERRAEAWGVHNLLQGKGA